MEYTSRVRIAQPGSIEVAREKLDKSEVRNYQIMNLLLSLGYGALVRRRELLFDVERIKMARDLLVT